MKPVVIAVLLLRTVAPASLGSAQGRRRDGAGTARNEQAEGGVNTRGAWRQNAPYGPHPTLQAIA